MEKTHYNRTLMVQGREKLPLPYHNPNEHSNDVDDDFGSFTFFENLTLHFIRNNGGGRRRERDTNGRRIRIVLKPEGQLPLLSLIPSLPPSISNTSSSSVHDLSVHDV